MTSFLWHSLLANTGNKHLCKSQLYPIHVHTLLSFLRYRTSDMEFQIRILYTIVPLTLLLLNTRQRVTTLETSIFKFHSSLSVSPLKPWRLKYSCHVVSIMAILHPHSCKKTPCVNYSKSASQVHSSKLYLLLEMPDFLSFTRSVTCFGRKSPQVS